LQRGIKFGAALHLFTTEANISIGSTSRIAQLAQIASDNCLTTKLEREQKRTTEQLFTTF
jgi:hypothetical protein